MHTLHLPPDPAIAAALRDATRTARPPAVAGVSAFQARAWERFVRVDAILPPYVRRVVIAWSPAAGNGAVFAGRLSPEKGAAEAIDIARAAGIAIDVYGDAYDPDYAREQIGPRRAEPGVAVHPGVARTSLWTVMAARGGGSLSGKMGRTLRHGRRRGAGLRDPGGRFPPRRARRDDRRTGVTGFLVAPDDIRAAADSVRRVTGISRSACRSHAERHLDLERSLDAHEQLYGRVVSPGAGTAAGR